MVHSPPDFGVCFIDSIWAPSFSETPNWKVFSIFEKLSSHFPVVTAACGYPELSMNVPVVVLLLLQPFPFNKQYIIWSFWWLLQKCMRCLNQEGHKPSFIPWRLFLGGKPLVKMAFAVQVLSFPTVYAEVSRLQEPSYEGGEGAKPVICCRLFSDWMLWELSECVAVLDAVSFHHGNGTYSVVGLQRGPGAARCRQYETCPFIVIYCDRRGAWLKGWMVKSNPLSSRVVWQKRRDGWKESKRGRMCVNVLQPWLSSELNIKCLVSCHADPICSSYMRTLEIKCPGC